MNYEVICGNIGSVFSGNSLKTAEERYLAYVEASKAECGRAGGEDVTLMCNGEPIREHTGSLHANQGE